MRRPDIIVYVIKAESIGKVKIGIAIDVNIRLAQLQASSPAKLELIGCWIGSKEEEKRLHRQFDQFHSHREWFDLDESILELARNHNQLTPTNEPGKFELKASRGQVFDVWTTCRLSRPKRDAESLTSTRVDLSPQTMKLVESKRAKLRPIPKLKPFIEMLIAEALQLKPQPEGER